MKRAVRASLLAALLLAAGCAKDDTVLYGEYAMGTVSGRSIISDGGLTYDVAEQQCPGLLDTMKRVLFRCDILRRTGNDRYDIRLREMQSVLCKDPIEAASMDGDAVGDDPVRAISIWSGNGYLNFLIGIAVLNGSDTRHFINLVHDGASPSADTLYFSLRHNAYGEYFGAEGTEDAYFELGRSYVSFPVGRFIPEGRESMPVRIFWRWHAEEDGRPMKETDTFSAAGEIRRGR